MSLRALQGAGNKEEAVDPVIDEIAGRSAFHAHAAALCMQMQQGLERQRRIWNLRAEAERCRGLLAEAERALKVEEEEQKLERKLADEMLRQLDGHSKTYALATQVEARKIVENAKT